MCYTSIATMVVNGLIFGERSIYFDGSNYVIDRKNLLMAEIKYNAKNNGLFSSENPDYFSAFIYQVHPNFIEKFLVNRVSPKKDDKNRLLEQFHGEWNGAIISNSKEIFNFEKDLPAML